MELVLGAILEFMNDNLVADLDTQSASFDRVKVVLFANTDWYLYNFRSPLALALQSSGHEVLLISPPGPYGDRFAGMGLRWVAVPMDRRSLNPLREGRLLFWLAALLRVERPDVMHSFTIKAAIYGSIAARMAGVGARINAVDGMGYVFTSNDLKAQILRPVVRTLMRVAFGGRRTRLILQNPDDLEVFASARLVDRDNIRLIPGVGVDCSRFVSRVGSVVESGRCRVLLAARLLWDKGLAEFVGAARLLREQGREIEFMLAGAPDPGNPAAVPEAMLGVWEEEGLLLRLGHVDDMPALLRQVSIMVLPSYREGLPTGLIEAAACGIPIVTTDVPGCRFVVSHEVDGLLVPARDAGALAAAIARLQDDPALAARLGIAARAKVLAQFEETTVLERTMAVYRELTSVA